MERMDERPTTTVPMARLSGLGQLYVTSVGALAVLTVLEGSHAWYVALVVLALPLSLLALWVGFYAGMAVGFAVGAGGDHQSWPVAVVWVAVWTMTAWVNAQLVQKVRRRGWAAVAPRSHVERDFLEDAD
jgi:hypothetical protein